MSQALLCAKHTRDASHTRAGAHAHTHTHTHTRARAHTHTQHTQVSEDTRLHFTDDIKRNLDRVSEKKRERDDFEARLEAAGALQAAVRALCVCAVCAACVCSVCMCCVCRVCVLCVP